MKQFTWLTSLAVAGLLYSNAATAAGGPTKAEEEAHVLRKIHLVNGLEIKAGKLAVQNSGSQQVRDYGRMLVADHTAADAKVAALAKAENVDLIPPTPKDDGEKIQIAKNKLAIDKLEALSGVNFDRAFEKAMSEGHAQTIAELQGAEVRLKGTKVAGLIDELLPGLRKHEKVANHLEHARAAE